MIKGRALPTISPLDLTPKNTSALLDAGLSVYRRLGGRLLREAFGPSVMIYVGLVLLFNVLFPGIFTTNDPDSLAVQGLELISWVGLALVCILPLMLIGLALLSVSATRAVWVLMQPRSAPKLNQSARHTGAMVLLALHSGLISMAPLIILLAYLFGIALVEQRSPDINTAGFSFVAVIMTPATILLAGTYISLNLLAPSALVVEGLNLKEALKRSRILGRQYRGLMQGVSEPLINLIFRCLVLMGVILGGFNLVFSQFDVSGWLRQSLGTTPYNELAMVMLQGLPMLLAVWLVAPYWGICSTLIYADRRSRLEGLDITLMKEQLSA